LLPGDEGTDGRALILRGDGEVRNEKLPALSPAGRRPFDAYMESCARRSKLLRGDGTVTGYTDAGDTQTRDIVTGRSRTGSLEELCEWAGPTVSVLLANLPAVPTPGSPARVVLVPCGTLGVVPWAAAKLPEKPADGSGRPARACDMLVLSYAASGAELLRSLRRERTQYDADPLLVVDPSRTLKFAAREAAAIRGAFLRDARVLGSADGLPCTGPGTPQEVLTALSGSDDDHPHPASMVQIIAHGTASVQPTTSRLLLADPGADPAAPGERGTVGPRHLTVERILAAPPFDRAAGGGPLVVLDSCDTDLSNRDHDEAMTLTSAFVAQGAADAVGSRWSVDDWSTAVCMVVFHHYLATANLAPAEALRAAQLWMLGPERECIPALEDDLLRREDRPREALQAVSAWGAFIHQGSPRPVRSGVRETT